MQTSPGKITGFAVVRSKEGYIRAGNFDNLNQEHKRALIKLIVEDGNITAESYPNTDERFT